MGDGTAAQYYRCQCQQCEGIGNEDQGVDSHSKSVEREVMESMLLQYDGIVDGKDLCQHLNGGRRKGNWAKGTAQKEQWDGCSHGKCYDRLALLQYGAQQCTKGDEDGEREKGKANHFI